MFRVVVVGIALAGSACVSSASIECSNGEVCPSGTECYAPMGLCVDPAQLSGCAGLEDQMPCAFGAGTAGTCHGGVCLEQICGDGIIEAPEQCEQNDLKGVDDCMDLGYYTSGPVECDVDCTYDRRQCQDICGDGMIDSAHETCDAEAGVVVAQCDDQDVGYYNAGDVTCNAACQLETTGCTGFCGDNIINGSEVCDGTPPAGGCLAYGFGYGPLACSRCGPDFVNCGMLGWQDEPFAFFTNGVPVIMGRAPGDYWVTQQGAAFHIVDRVARRFPLSAPEGRSVWVQGDQVFIAGGVQVRHGLVATNGDVTWSMMAMPGANVITDFIWGTGVDDIYVLGHSYNTLALQLFHYNGSVWTAKTAPPTTQIPLAFFALSGAEMWVSTYSGGTGTLWHWSNSNWSTVTGITGIFSSQTHIRSIWAADSTHVYVGGDTGFAFWNGSSWTPTTTPAPAQHINGSSASDVVIAGFGFIWQRDGARWATLTTADFNLGTFATGGLLYSVANGTSGIGLVKSTTRSLWLPEPFSGGGDNYDMWIGPDTAVLVGLDLTTIRNSLGVWSAVDTGAESTFQRVWGVSANDFYLLNGSSLVHEVNGAPVNVTAPLTALGFTSLRDLWGSSASDVWVVDADALLHWDGDLWTKTPMPYTLLAIDGTGPNDVWVVTDTADTLLHFDGAWSPVTVPMAGAITGVDAVAPGVTFVSGTTTLAARNGTTWSVFPATKPHGYVWGRSAKDAFALDTDGGLDHFDGKVWTPVRMKQYGNNVGITGDDTHVYTWGVTGETLYRHSLWN